MKKITAKTLEDLEFPEIRKQLEAFCHTGPGRQAARSVTPFRDAGLLQDSLARASEYLASFENDNQIPNHGFEPVDSFLGMLKVENSLLPIEAFRHMSDLAGLIRDHQRFFKKFADYYPYLNQWVARAEFHAIIPERIGGVIDRFGEIRDDASDNLREIRRKMEQARAGINKSFNSALSRYQQADYLDEIRESVVENRRVLAVKAMYRRKVKGNVLGTSKTGSIVYVEPEATERHNRELQLLELDEKDEIHKILRALGADLRPFIPDLATYQDVMTEIDLTAAKARYAASYGGILPEINSDRKHYLRDAYHPLLLLSNRKQGLKTWPQTIGMHPENRIIVISGPNAGGKSITLKTIGLLQVMLQSGLLIPVHERSSCRLYDQVLTDIGDNQSIENHLSTYSYRLKNMNRFLRKCNAETLFLIDEFGTGSDPELGGALAETFLETFYERGSFGVITTHYANLKALAGELPHASNANMLFDRKTLEPVFSLEVGQPGSSFTFEVAQKNGIPFSLINKAKKKVSRGKVRFDESIAKLQKERSKMAKTGDRLQEEESKAREEAEKLETLNSKLKEKLSSYQELYDYHQRMIHLGTRVDKAAERYFREKKKRPLISELLRIVETENSKRKKPSAESRAEIKKKEQANQQIKKEIKEIRSQKAAKKKQEEKRKKSRPKPVLKVGDRVRLQDGKSVGSIDSIEKDKAIVNYGIFTTNVSVDQLELVEKGKKG
ncbi:endonuclease MutS2 [Robiginitalea biformata]|uniref:DNA mismatch repair protein MutS n=1 Tax=Robiginitalea biformata (strain ATCC BAA-864 / DSM 15991 / KCTC 12146 / HTCC2501) TaxID=313596 RepID=A4CL29_ROBBH|nr:DNA mismatch repair protein MutS [Robiginitalea biformata]EAR15578.1 DNA mismatch repair protein MutS [Robiginitalea biformata HTCC2501]